MTIKQELKQWAGLRPNEAAIKDLADHVRGDPYIDKLAGKILSRPKRNLSPEVRAKKADVIQRNSKKWNEIQRRRRGLKVGGVTLVAGPETVKGNKGETDEPQND